MLLGFNINMRNSYQEIRDFGELLLKTKEFHAVEITYSQHMRHINTEKFHSEIQALVSKYHPIITIHFPDFNLAEENVTLQKAILEEFDACCQYARELECKKIIIHSGSRKLMHISIFHEDGSRQTHDEVYAKLWKLSVETMKSICQIAKLYNIEVCTENLAVTNLIMSADDLNRYIQEVNEENLNIVFDVGHSYYTGHCIEEEIRKCNHLLTHLHIHDNHGMKDEHLPVGQGDIDWKKFHVALNDIDYKGIYMMELYHTTVLDLIESKQKLLAYL